MIRVSIIYIVFLLFFCYSDALRIPLDSDHPTIRSDVGHFHEVVNLSHVGRETFSSSTKERFITLEEWLYLPDSQEMARMLKHSQFIKREGGGSERKENATLSDFFRTGVHQGESPQLSEVGSCGRYVVVARHPINSLQSKNKGQVEESGAMGQEVPFQTQEHSLAADALSVLRSRELEVHVIDSNYVLVYLPTGDESDISAAFASRAVTLGDSLGEWKLIDVYSGKDSVKPRLELFLFKISRTLKELLTAAQACNRESCDAFVSHARKISTKIHSLSPSSTPSESMQELRIIVSTARGHSIQVAEDLDRICSIQGVKRAANESDVFGAGVPLLRIPRESNSCKFSVTKPTGLSDDTAEVVRVNLMFPLPYVDTQNDSYNAGSDALRSGCSCVLKILKIAFHPSVRWLEVSPQYAEVHNLNASAIIQSGYIFGMNVSLARPLWDAGLNGTNEIVGIADTGVEHKSCYFHDPKQEVAHYPDVNFNHRKIISYQGCSAPGSDHIDYTDTVQGHGTHVAGSAVGSALFDSYNTKEHPEAQMNFSQYNGLAPGAKLFFRDLGCLESEFLQIPDHISEVYDSGYKNGARIYSNSWGVYDIIEYGTMEKQVDNYSYRHDDMLILFSSGNNASRGICMPGTSKNVLTVGAHHNSLDPDDQNKIPRFSRGPTYDNRLKPDLVAPGGWNVVSAKSNSKCATTVKFGTSMATGLAAGAAALVREYLRTRLANTMPSASLLKALMIHSTVPLLGKYESGFGRLDLSISFGNNRLRTKSGGAEVVEAAQPRLWMIERKAISDGDTHVYCFSAIDPIELENVFRSGDAMAADLSPKTMGLKTTLVWTDIPIALEGSKRTLVHDLDLAVVDYTGEIYYSNTIQPKVRLLDRRNTVEQVNIKLTKELSTSFRVLVHGREIRGSPSQEYSLVVSAPGLKEKENCPAEFALLEQNNIHVQCPDNCSARNGATCLHDSRQCECPRGLIYYDCSMCDGRTYCNGQGVCDEKTMTCTCFPGTHFSDPYCSVCSSGWYGPRCDFDCSCMNNNPCDKSLGVCECSQNRTYGGAGCYQGNRCEYCCRDFYGKHCNEISYWCDASENVVEVNDPRGGYIQINGFGSYFDISTCHWRITAPLKRRILIEYIEFNVDKSDMLYVYDPISKDGINPLRKSTGLLKEKVKVRSIGNVLNLAFVSDWSAYKGGFLLHYRFSHSIECQHNCIVSFDMSQEVPSDLMCGDILGLPDWCTCNPPQVGWNCNATSDSPDILENISEVKRWYSRPQFSFLSSEALLVLDALFSEEVPRAVINLGSETNAGEGEMQNNRMHPTTSFRSTSQTIPTGGIARMPLVVNGYSLLRVYAAIGSNSSSMQKVSREGVTLFVNLTLIPINSTWVHEVQGLKLGVALVNQLDSDFLFNNFSTMQLLDLYACRNKPSLSMLVPLDVKALGGRAEGKSLATVELLITLLWNASEPVPWQFQKHQAMDAVVFASAQRYITSSMGESSSKIIHVNEPNGPVDYDKTQLIEEVNLRLNCGPQQSFDVGPGRLVKQSRIEIVNEVVYVRYNYLMTLQFILLIVFCFACVTGIIVYKNIQTDLVRRPRIEFHTIGNIDNSTTDQVNEILVASTAEDPILIVNSTARESLQASPTYFEKGP